MDYDIDVLWGLLSEPVTVLSNLVEVPITMDGNNSAKVIKERHVMF
jgi:hypothetical protein